MLCQYCEFEFLAFHLGCVSDPQVGHGAKGHNDVFTIQAFVIAGQMGRNSSAYGWTRATPLFSSTITWLDGLTYSLASSML